MRDLTQRLAPVLAGLALLVIALPVAAADAYGSAAEIHPLLLGSAVPSVEVLALDGTGVDLESVVGEKRAVVIFYRGGWWPYCNTQLGQLQSIESDIREAGFELLAIGTDQPSKIEPTVAQHKLGYTIYSDKSAAAARAYGIAYTMDAESLATYKKYGIDLEAASGESHHQLPVPSVFVYAGGKMVFQYVNPDYRVRVPGEVLLAALHSVAD